MTEVSFNNLISQDLGKPLVSSGMGRELSLPKDLNLEMLVSQLVDLVTKYKLVIIRDLDLTEAGFRNFLSSLGLPVQHKGDQASVGYGFGDILKLDGGFQETKVVTGRGPLPLHSDGVLLSTQIDLIVFYCVASSEGSQSGSTFVCDQLTALREAPPSLLKKIKENGIEYSVVEKGFFTTVADKDWFPINAFHSHNGEDVLKIALPFPKGSPTSWKARVANLLDIESEKLLADLSKFLEQPRYTYRHRWKTGDLMLVDNHTTLHGRDAIEGDSVRQIWRGQALLR
ncbi:hypothetical protein BLD44_006435 [Mastigocladus laminosus UU774]|nr:hypothetical protein BLD44_006435 [Mastigocladus laminosus UU774]